MFSNVTITKYIFKICILNKNIFETNKADFCFSESSLKNSAMKSDTGTFCTNCIYRNIAKMYKYDVFFRRLGKKMDIEIA